VSTPRAHKTRRYGHPNHMQMVPRMRSKTHHAATLPWSWLCHTATHTTLVFVGRRAWGIHSRASCRRVAKHTTSLTRCTVATSPHCLHRRSHRVSRQESDGFDSLFSSDDSGTVSKLACASWHSPTCPLLVARLAVNKRPLPSHHPTLPTTN
jgi:hypothetical protein